MRPVSGSCGAEAGDEMDERATYGVYNSLMKLHLKYADCKADREHAAALVAEINAINSQFNSNFCNSMTDALRRWFLLGFPGVEKDGVKAFYVEIWQLHKKYIGMQRDNTFWQMATEDLHDLGGKYGYNKPVQDMALSIMDELEMSG